MRILLISQYFWPETFIINELVETLTQQGHTIKVLTGKPNYPNGEIFAGYTKKGIVSESFIPGVTVFRAPLRSRGKGGAKNLILNYLSFVMNGLRFFPSAIKGESYDVVFAFGLSPITSIIPAIFLKWRLKSHLAVWIQDLWPESLKATGFIRNPFLLWLVGQLVRAIYYCSDTILAQSHAFKAPISRYAKENKIVYYPNSYNDSNSATTDVPQIPENLLNELNSKFCVVFAGNLGIAQSLPTLVDAAEQLQDLPDFRLVFVGSGSMSEWLSQQKKEKKLDNIIIAGRFPALEMPHILSRAAALLVSLKKDEIFSYTIPSKIQAYLAAGKPIIAALDGEAARVVERAEAGLTCPSEDSQRLAQCIRTIYKLSPIERNKMGASGRAYFLENFNMPTQANKLIEILNERIKSAK
ncbi:glycosyltransferase family 4 protein [Legionella bozemanae]|uniref:glycosyltransferase family 4 protein n=1 Tax=Legionella bozemanae TaxID=447 RepID=UPI00399CADD5